MQFLVSLTALWAIVPQGKEVQDPFGHARAQSEWRGPSGCQGNWRWDIERLHGNLRRVNALLETSRASRLRWSRDRLSLFHTGLDGRAVFEREGTRIHLEERVVSR